MKKSLAVILTAVFVIGTAATIFAQDMEILGVTFPGEKTIDGKVLKLNGVSYRRALGVVKVYAVGLYLEEKTNDAEEVIESEQMKHMFTHYLTSKATAKKISEGFVDLIKECNPPELVEANQAEIDLFASWLDKDMAPGLTSYTTYIPGQGLILTYQDEVRGTIPGDEFMKMYYRYNVGENAKKKLREGLLGLE